MQVSVTFQVPEKNLAALIAQLTANKLTTTLADDEITEPKKRGRPAGAKNKAAPVVDEEEVDAEAEETEEEETEEELDAEDDEDETEDDEEEAPAKKTKAAPKGPDMDKDILPAFQAYAKKHGREKGHALLKKLKVKAVRDLKPEQFATALKLLK